MLHRGCVREAAVWLATAQIFVPCRLRAGDLISNGSFDADLSGWSDAETSVWVYDGHVSGPGCVEVRAEGGDPRAVTQRVAVVPGGSYRLSAAIAAGSATGVTGFVRLGIRDARGALLAGYARSSSADDWQVRCEEVAVPAGGVWAEIALEANCAPSAPTDWARFDDVSLRELALPAHAGLLYAIDADADLLHLIDLRTGACGVLGSTKRDSGGNEILEIPSCLAWDGEQLYARDAMLSWYLYTLDPATGRPARSPAVSLVGAQSLAADLWEGCLYATTDEEGSPLYRIDKATGNAVRVMTTGYDAIGDIAFDSRHTLWAVMRDSGDVVPLLGEGAPFSIGRNGLEGFDIHPLTGAFYVYDNVADALYLADPATGKTNRIGPPGQTANVKGLRTVRSMWPVAASAEGVLGATEARGILFLATSDVVLTGFAQDWDLAAVQDISLAVYEGSEESGVYRLVVESSRLGAGPGRLLWHSSPMQARIRRGKYYALLLFPTSAASCRYDSSPPWDDLPFGKVIGGAVCGQSRPTATASVALDPEYPVRTLCTADLPGSVWLYADFESKAVDAAIETGGAYACEPVAADPVTCVVVRSSPPRGRCLALEDASDSYEVRVVFGFYRDWGLRYETTVLEADVVVVEDDGLEIAVRERWNSAVDLGTLSFDRGNLIFSNWATTPQDVGDYLAGGGYNVRFVFERDQGRSALYLDGQLACCSDQTAFPDAAAGSLHVSLPADKDHDGIACVDNIVVFIGRDGDRDGDGFPDFARFLSARKKLDCCLDLTFAADGPCSTFELQGSDAPGTGAWTSLEGVLARGMSGYFEPEIGGLSRRVYRVRCVP